jgi:hypothetical protein
MFLIFQDGRNFLEQFATARQIDEVRRRGPFVAVCIHLELLRKALGTPFQTHFELGGPIFVQKGKIKAVDIPSRENVDIDVDKKITELFNQIGRIVCAMHNQIKAFDVANENLIGFGNAVLERKDMPFKAIFLIGAPDGCAQTNCEIAFRDIGKESVVGHHLAIKGTGDPRRQIRLVKRLDSGRLRFNFNLARRPTRVGRSPTCLGRSAFKPSGHGQPEIIAELRGVLDRLIDKGDREAALILDEIFESIFQDGPLALRVRGDRDLTKFGGLERVVLARNLAVKTFQATFFPLKAFSKRPHSAKDAFIVESIRHFKHKAGAISMDRDCNGMTFRSRCKA